MRTVIPNNARLIPESAELVFKGKIFDVYQWQQEQFDGTYKTFEMLKRPDTIVVIAIKDDKLVVLEQEQPGYPAFYDFSGGRHDVETENELAAAKRELLEETGMSFKTWRLVDIIQPVSKIEWFIYTYVTIDFESQVAQHLDAGEKISVQLMDFKDALELSKHPKARNMSKDLLEKAGSLEGLATLPNISTGS